MASAVACSVQPFRAHAACKGRAAARGQRLQLACAAGERGQDAAAAVDRRSLLLGVAGAAVAAPLLAAAPASAGERDIGPSALTVLQRQGLINELISRTSEEMKKVLTAGDAPQVAKLLLHDCATYDRETGTGGCNGSVVLPEELGRPENAGLKPVVEKLRKAKEASDARRREGQAPLSWADTIVIAAKVTQELAWREDKISKAADEKKGAMIADGFGNAIFIRIGRKDATAPDAGVSRLPADDAPFEEVQKFFSELGPKKGKPFLSKQQYLLWSNVAADPLAMEQKMADFSPEWANWKRQFDSSKKTVTRTSYEEDLGAAIKQLSDLGVKYDANMYLCPISVFVPDRF